MAVVQPDETLSRRQQVSVVVLALVVLGVVFAWESGTGPDVLVWFHDRLEDLWKRDAAAWVALVQTGLAIVGGLWVFYLYRTSRTGQTTISITPTCWLS